MPGRPRDFLPGQLTDSMVVDQEGIVYRVIQRLIMDERAGNCWWRNPPRAQLTSPEVVSDIDESCETLAEAVAEEDGADGESMEPPSV